MNKMYKPNKQQKKVLIQMTKIAQQNTTHEDSIKAKFGGDTYEVLQTNLGCDIELNLLLNEVMVGYCMYNEELLQYNKIIFFKGE
jgi:hypothetical protein